MNKSISEDCQALPQREDSCKVIGEGRFLRLVDRNSWEYVERKKISGIVAIVPVTRDSLIFVEQYRPPVDKIVIEFPAGLVGDVSGFEDETCLTSAQRELEEETGYKASSIKWLAKGPASAGATAESIDLFLAEGLTKVSQGGGVDDENITVHLVPKDKIFQWLKDQEKQGKAVDLKVYAGLYFAQKEGLI